MLLIDNRAGSRDFVKFFTEHTAELGTMDFGDVSFEGNGPNGKITIGIEIKSKRDYLNSIMTGRLAGHQLPGMVEKYDRSYLYVYRDFTRLEAFKRATSSHNYMIHKNGQKVPLKQGTTEVTDQSDMSFQLSCAEFFNVTVKMFSSKEAVARAMWMTYKYWQKPYTKHGTGGVVYNSATAGWTGRVSPLVKMAATIPGVGADRARAIAKEFDSLEDMINAGVARWSRIDGIGDKLARDILKFLRST